METLRAVRPVKVGGCNQPSGAYFRLRRANETRLSAIFGERVSIVTNAILDVARLVGVRI
jgi:hypothetical protein